MPIDFQLSKIVIRCFLGIEELTLDLRHGYPSVLIGTNNSGKTTILNAVALALNRGGFHRWQPEESDFYCGENGSRATEFLVQVHFHSDDEFGYPAVKGVAKPSIIHGVQVKGKTDRDGKMSHSRTLFDKNGSAVTIAPRTSLSAEDKQKFADHGIGFKKVNARLDDIRDHMPDVWLFKPQEIEASLYVWKSGPIAKLSALLADRFLTEQWEMELKDGKGVKPMPETMYRGYEFFQEAICQFPFWNADMKPHLEAVISRYVGAHTKIDLKPDTQIFEEWIAQQLSISLATDPDSPATPLRSMGDGWQSIIRLAALEALTKYPQITKDRVVLLLEEPETHLHPHLRRKLRNILSRLAATGWTVIYSTHSAELVSFDEKQAITRLVRVSGKVEARTVHTDKLDPKAKLQSKLDERGAHDFLFGTAVVFCEGKEDSFAIRLGFEQCGIDCDARSVSVTQCGSISAIPAFTAISKELGIRWCALTDQDLLPDGTTKPATARDRDKIEKHRGQTDRQIQWPINLEHCLGVIAGKITPDVTFARLSNSSWKADYPEFKRVLDQITVWIDPALKV